MRDTAKSVIRFLGLILLCLCCTTMVQAGQPERIVFQLKNAADARGFVNVLWAFRTACLAQPITRDLPAQLVPEGYQVVTPAVHMFGKEDGSFPNSAILSKTGREDSDIAGGYPMIEMSPPTGSRQDSYCVVTWRRLWSQDYPDGARRLSLDMAASLPARVSYYLGAALLTQPDNVFSVSDQYGYQTTWAARCHQTKLCTFELEAHFDQEGLGVTISFRGELSAPRQ